MVSVVKADLDPAVFGLEPNVSVMAQVVTAQLAARRAGTQSTKTRAEVSGGGSKPWAQKGTGRARAGSSRSPIWTGGGVALGPKPRKYTQPATPAMNFAFRRIVSGSPMKHLLNLLAGDTPSTKAAKAALASLGTEGRVLVVLADADAVAARSFRNLPEVQIIAARELNAYDVLVNDFVVFTQATLPTSAPAATEEAAQ